jgi:hypothetical protein
MKSAGTQDSSRLLCSSFPVQATGTQHGAHEGAVFCYNDCTMDYSKTVLIVPTNDAEAVLIKQIAEQIGIPTIESHQLHGASLDKGHDYVAQVIDGGYTKAVIVEMPGVESEEKLRSLGVEVVIVDHHHYTGLARAHAPDGKLLPSSLEQFLEMFQITNAQLRKMKFDPRLVQGIGIQDRGYIWALQEEGYSRAEIKSVMEYMDALTAHHRNPKTEARKQRLSEKAWAGRKQWREFIVVTTRADLQLRPRLSRIIVDEIGKPTPLIVVEHHRGLIYVQESPYALHLFERFGGFTFGLDRNWGHRNEPGGEKITLRDVKDAIKMVSHQKETL